MLILSRKLNESIVIDGRIIVKVLRIDKDTVKGAPKVEPNGQLTQQEEQDLFAHYGIARDGDESGVHKPGFEERKPDSDEPVAGLRAAEKSRLRDVFLDLKARGFTQVLVEHDMQFVGAVADRVLVLDRGRLIADGPPSAMRHDERLARLGRATSAAKTPARVGRTAARLERAGAWPPCPRSRPCPRRRTPARR